MNKNSLICFLLGLIFASSIALAGGPETLSIKVSVVDGDTTPTVRMDIPAVILVEHLTLKGELKDMRAQLSTLQDAIAIRQRRVDEIEKAVADATSLFMAE